MASISTDKKGLRRILFVGADGVRRPIRLGRVPMKTARTIKSHVENLAAAALGKHAPDPETSAWVGALDSVLHDKLASVGLVLLREATPAAKAVKLGDFLEAYIKGRSDVKGSTATVYGHTQRCLVEYFGAGKPLHEITSGDADDWRLWLGENRKLADNTARRRYGIAKQFFRSALRRRLIRENPFADMKGCDVKANTKRHYFITRDEAQAVLDACPDAQWRLLFALSRFGGLRCPSEHLGLRWADVDWERNRITVHSPKTEHHEGGESRQIPIFAEVRPYLEAVYFAALETGELPEYIITRYRSPNANLRTQLERIIKLAGLKPWPKLFQNLRSTRETELAETHPLHVVCSWIGNSQAVAAKHYLQVTDADFDRASRGGAESGALCPKNAAQNRAQPMSADPRQPSQETQKALEGQGLRHAMADDGGVWPCVRVGGTGLEPATSTV
jgi:integrase